MSGPSRIIATYELEPSRLVDLYPHLRAPTASAFQLSSGWVPDLQQQWYPILLFLFAGPKKSGEQAKKDYKHQLGLEILRIVGAEKEDFILDHIGFRSDGEDAQLGIYFTQALLAERFYALFKGYSFKDKAALRGTTIKHVHSDIGHRSGEQQRKAGKSESTTSFLDPDGLRWDPTEARELTTAGADISLEFRQPFSARAIFDSIRFKFPGDDECIYRIATSQRIILKGVESHCATITFESETTYEAMRDHFSDPRACRDLWDPCGIRFEFLSKNSATLNDSRERDDSLDEWKAEVLTIVKAMDHHACAILSNEWQKVGNGWNGRLTCHETQMELTDAWERAPSSLKEKYKLHPTYIHESYGNFRLYDLNARLNSSFEEHVSSFDEGGPVGGKRKVRVVETEELIIVEGGGGYGYLLPQDTSTGVADRPKISLPHGSHRGSSASSSFSGSTSGPHADYDYPVAGPSLSRSSSTETIKPCKAHATPAAADDVDDFMSIRKKPRFVADAGTGGMWGGEAGVKNTDDFAYGSEQGSSGYNGGTSRSAARGKDGRQTGTVDENFRKLRSVADVGEGGMGDGGMGYMNNGDVAYGVGNGSSKVNVGLTISGASSNDGRQTRATDDNLHFPSYSDYQQIPPPDIHASPNDSQPSPEYQPIPPSSIAEDDDVGFSARREEQ